MEIMYEHHTGTKSEFPFIFHEDTACDFIHWHENIEILYFFSGTAEVLSGVERYSLKAGEIAIINPNQMHSIYPGTDGCRYNCLIIDKDFTEELLCDEPPLFHPVLHNNNAADLIKQIAKEAEQKGEYYRLAVKALVATLLTQLCRTQSASDNTARPVDKQKADIVKGGLSIIRKRYSEPLTIDEICSNIGVSKYYFCRLFKAYTGQTTVDYINFLRCSNARNLIRNKGYNVNESARKSGISNLSYFTRLYKKHMGILPGAEKQ